MNEKTVVRIQLEGADITDIISLGKGVTGIHEVRPHVKDVVEIPPYVGLPPVYTHWTRFERREAFNVSSSFEPSVTNRTDTVEIHFAAPYSQELFDKVVEICLIKMTSYGWTNRISIKSVTAEQQVILSTTHNYDLQKLLVNA